MKELFSRALKILRSHGIPLLLFVALTFLIESPLIAFPHFAGDAYQGINIAHFGTDEHYYLGRGSEVVDGGSLGNPFLAMGKDKPDPTVSYAEYILTAPLRFSGLADRISIVDYYNILNFVGIIATLILIYTFAYLLSGNRLLASAAAIFALGGYSIVYNKSLFYNDFNIYGRSLFPWASSIPFFAFLLAAYQAVVKKSHYAYVAAASLLFAALWYDYFFAWSYVLAFLGTLILLYACARDWLAVKRIVLISLVGIILGLPAFISVIHQHIIADTGLLSYFYYTSHTHMPVMSWIGLASLILFAAFVYLRRNDPNALFILAIIITGWITLNQQVITGRELELGHYYWYFIVPGAIILASFMVWALLPRKWRIYFALLLVTLAFLNTAVGQYRSFSTTTDIKLHEQSYAPILEKLRTLPGGVVFSDPSANAYGYLPTIYTNKDIFFVGGALAHYMPFSRIEDTLLLSLYFEKNARENPRGFLERQLKEKKDNAYTLLFGYLEGYHSGLEYRVHAARMKNPDAALLKIREATLDQLDQDYKKAFVSGTDIVAKLKKEGVTYIIWDKEGYPSWDIDSLPGVSIILEEGSISLYSIE